MRAVFRKVENNINCGLSLTQDSKPESVHSDKFIEKTDPRYHATSHFGTGLYVDLWVNNAGVMGKNCIRDGKFFLNILSRFLPNSNEYLPIYNHELEIQSRVTQNVFLTSRPISNL